MGKIEDIQLSRTVMQISEGLMPTMRGVARAAADDEARPILNALALFPMNDQGEMVDVAEATTLDVVATDSYRLHRLTLKGHEPTTHKVEWGDVSEVRTKKFGSDYDWLALNLNLVDDFLAPAGRRYSSPDSPGQVLLMPALDIARVAGAGRGDGQVSVEVIGERKHLNPNEKLGEYLPVRVTFKNTKQRDATVWFGTYPGHYLDLMKRASEDTQWFEVTANQVLGLKRVTKAATIDHAVRLPLFLHLNHLKEVRGQITAKMITNHYTVEAKLDYERQPRREFPEHIAFNPEYLIQAYETLTAALSERMMEHIPVRIRLRDELKPMLLTVGERDDIEVLLMPVRV